jgi:hypothetical protein
VTADTWEHMARWEEEHPGALTLSAKKPAAGGIVQATLIGTCVAAGMDVPICLPSTRHELFES